MWTTRYIGPTDTKPSRIRVTDAWRTKSKVYSFDSSTSDPHTAAVAEFVNEFGDREADAEVFGFDFERIGDSESDRGFVIVWA